MKRERGVRKEKREREKLLKRGAEEGMVEDVLGEGPEGGVSLHQLQRQVCQLGKQFYSFINNHRINLLFFVILFTFRLFSDEAIS